MVLVVQDDSVNASRIATTIVAVITSSTALAAVGGDVFVPAASGLSKDSVINVSQLLTVNKTDLDEPVGRIPDHLMEEVDLGLRLVLGV